VGKNLRGRDSADLSGKPIILAGIKGGDTLNPKQLIGCYHYHMTDVPA
jgi:hypothetical protein